ncbi:hypothetical protein O5D80_008538 [Batrachochytrium dendrobatidis]|nr:hypothetical protein O5D80_008538 [Batrachochytrium dendrobatidis]
MARQHTHWLMSNMFLLLLLTMHAWLLVSAQSDTVKSTAVSATTSISSPVHTCTSNSDCPVSAPNCLAGYCSVILSSTTNSPSETVLSQPTDAAHHPSTNQQSASPFTGSAGFNVANSTATPRNCSQCNLPDICVNNVCQSPFTHSFFTPTVILITAAICLVICGLGACLICFCCKCCCFSARNGNKSGSLIPLSAQKASNDSSKNNPEKSRKGYRTYHGGANKTTAMNGQLSATTTKTSLKDANLSVTTPDPVYTAFALPLHTNNKDTKGPAALPPNYQKPCDLLDLVEEVVEIVPQPQLKPQLSQRSRQQQQQQQRQYEHYLQQQQYENLQRKQLEQQQYNTQQQYNMQQQQLQHISLEQQLHPAYENQKIVPQQTMEQTSYDNQSFQQKSINIPFTPASAVSYSHIQHQPVIPSEIGPVMSDQFNPPSAPGFFAFWDKYGWFHQGYTDKYGTIHGGIFDDEGRFHFGYIGAQEPVEVELDMMARSEHTDESYDGQTLVSSSNSKRELPMTPRDLDDHVFQTVSRFNTTAGQYGGNYLTLKVELDQSDANRVFEDDIPHSATIANATHMPTESEPSILKQSSQQQHKMMSSAITESRDAIIDSNTVLNQQPPLLLSQNNTFVPKKPSEEPDTSGYQLEPSHKRVDNLNRSLFTPTAIGSLDVYHDRSINNSDAYRGSP